jgi:hypothetical protein
VTAVLVLAASVVGVVAPAVALLAVLAGMLLVLSWWLSR